MQPDPEIVKQLVGMFSLQVPCPSSSPRGIITFLYVTYTTRYTLQALGYTVRSSHRVYLRSCRPCGPSRCAENVAV